ncbi:MAG: 50S ribosomal protein L18 [Catalinimonas sp.]
MALRKSQRRQRIRYRIRNRLAGTTTRPRLSVFRSNKEIYAQVIDDVAGHTLFSASSRDAEGDSAGKVDVAREVGKKLAEKTLAGGVSEIVFDRGGYLYHGRVKALAEGAREGGLKF